MPRSCTVCNNPDRAEIEKDLVNGVSLRDIARQWSVSKDAVARHKKDHLPANLTKAKEAHEVVQANDLLGQTQDLLTRARGILDTAERAGNLPTALRAIKEARGTLELLGKLQGELRDGTTVNILVNPSWMNIRRGILAALGSFPEARLAVAQALGEVGDEVERASD